MADDHQTFEIADSGASATYPCAAGQLKKSGHVMIKDRPCKIMDMSTSKTGKHGHAKVNIVGICIFTGKKHEDMCPSTHNMEVPVVTRVEYSVVNVEDDGRLCLLGADNECREDLDLPKIGAQLDEIGIKISEDFRAGKTVTVSVIKACNEEKIIACRCIQE